MEIARRFKLCGFLFVLLLLLCFAAATPIDPAVEESLRQQQRLQREQRELEQRRDAPSLELGAFQVPTTR